MIKIKKKKPMPLWQKVFYVFSFIFLIGAFIYLGTKNYSVPARRVTDAEAFSKEYGVSAKNKFKYMDGKNTLNVLKNGTGVIFMGYPENEWCKVYAEILYNAARDVELNTIYYYNFYKDRANNTHVYQNIVKELKSHLPVIDVDSQNIYGPLLVVVKNGQIIYYDDETSVRIGDIELDEFWTMDKRISKETDIFNVLFQFVGDSYDS